MHPTTQQALDRMAKLVATYQPPPKAKKPAKASPKANSGKK